MAADGSVAVDGLTAPSPSLRRPCRLWLTRGLCEQPPRFSDEWLQRFEQELRTRLQRRAERCGRGQTTD